MKIVALACGIATSIAALSTAPAFASDHHRHTVSATHGRRFAVEGRRSPLALRHPVHNAEGYDRGYGYPGSIIAEATARAQREPGVTLQLAPDAKQTATGGPVGGVPGFSGF